MKKGKKRKGKEKKRKKKKKRIFFSSFIPVFIEIMMHFRVDDVSNILLSDDTILQYGEQTLSPMILKNTKNRFDNNLEEKKDRLRQSLRVLARYLKHFREVANKKELTLKDTFALENQKYVIDVGDQYGDDYSHPDAVRNLQNVLSNLECNYISHVFI